MLLLTCGYEFRIPNPFPVEYLAWEEEKYFRQGEVKHVDAEGRPERYIGDETGHMEGLEYQRQSSCDTSRSHGTSPWRLETF